MKKIKCINIESGLQVSNDGTCRSCCLMKHQFDHNNKMLNVKENTFEEIYNSKSRKKIVNAFKNGIKHDACKVCWEEETAGKKSKRLRDNETFEGQQEKNVFQLFEINMGNTCNLKCRTCHPFSSSKWAQEWKELGFYKGDDKSYKNYLQTFNKAYTDDSLFWKSFKDNITNVLHIDFYGGEPFLVSKQWEMLNEIIEMDRAKDITIHYNTNGTIWDEEIFETLKQFKKVFIHFSIDAVGDRLYYIRHPAEWNLIFSNFIKVNQYNDNKQFFIGICNTISILNIFYLEELLDTISPYTNDIYLNLVFWPDHYTIKNLPKEIKKEITDKLLLVNEKYPYIGIKNIINFMNNHTADQKQWQRFLEITSAQDKLRSEKFETVFSEFYEIIKKYGFSI